MRIEILLALLAVPVTGGIVLARVSVRNRERLIVASRLARWNFATTETAVLPPLLRGRGWTENGINKRIFGPLLDNDILKALLVQAGYDSSLSSFLILTFALLVVPILVAFALNFELTAAALVSIVFAVMPWFFLKLKANARRNKFHEQLPDGMDLMVAVLRSGHSIPQAVQSVANEIPAPCGPEFEFILQRMNLGQALSDSMTISALRFQSDDLDLIRRAIAIQSEVGGSLAELLDKTNTTLRQRLKLARQLRVLTAQGRLTALIVGLLPVVLAIALNFLSPGYLQLLIDDSLGRLLMLAALFLEFLGLLVMHRMSVMRV